MRIMVLSGVVLGAMAGPLAAGGIEKACLRSDRFNGDRGLCACIQQAADMTLSGGDQRQVVRFIRNPDAAEKARRADSAAAQAFWQRYALFGETAEALCAPQPEAAGSG
ncbi:MAG: hypothetical protein N2422_01090 [Rhodobacteraceae bacterium]|nr:hypothetical protein [Paracoccaceae bacterium]